MSKAAEALARQFERMWAMFRDTVEKCPDEEWLKGGDWQLVPARWAVHAIGGGDFYLGENPEAYERPGRFGVEWLDGSLDSFPTRDEVRAASREVEATVVRFLRETPDDVLFGENAFPWTGDSPYERMVYLLRHTQVHIGDLGCVLRHRGLVTGEWQ